MKDINPCRFHVFGKSISQISLPEKFTYPFHYTPHPLCVMAAEEVKEYLSGQALWQDELRKGKMFGVLVVRNEAGETGYLAAFSGILAGRNVHPFFVPPVYDLQQPDGFFQEEENNISAINARINELETDCHHLKCRQALAEEKRMSEQLLSQARERMKAAKEERQRRRLDNPGEIETAAMVRESQHEKAELKRLKQQLEKRIAARQADVEALDAVIDGLKAERKLRSARLQEKLFRQFDMLNACGKAKNLCDIFKDTVQRIPPAGAGECAAPKLLQYAYLHRLHPLAMAEFWWGESPRGEIRRHGNFYPACKGKCEPILNHMLQGLDVEENPLNSGSGRVVEPEILFEDAWLLVIHKPENMLTVPGKSALPSVSRLMQARYPEAGGPMIVHRLDMATSGVLLIAKTKEVHRKLQAQFLNREIKKRYIALLDGHVSIPTGVIDLPLCLDPDDRPRQMVNYEYGRTAITRYEVIDHEDNRTRIAFFPLTGRTHQLRVHAAHPLGLNAPIVGDELYGRKAERLFLHAELIEFRHPVTSEMVCVKKEAPF